jgi:hypothetical protein
MSASRGGHGYSGGHGSGPSSRSSGSGRGRGRGRSQRGNYSNQLGGRSSGTNNSSMPQCQVCLKIGHTAKSCRYRCEDDSSFKPHSAAMASSGAADTTWYMNSGAMDHITGDLGKLTMHDPYCGHVSWCKSCVMEFKEATDSVQV